MLSFEIPRNKRLLFRRITPQMFEEICEKTSWIVDTSLTTLVERVFCLENNILFYPKCTECGSNVKWDRGRARYATYCSNKCGANSTKTHDKKKETCLENYGVANPFQSQVVKDKSKETCLEKYGVEFPAQSQEVQDKSKETCLEKYGVEYVSQVQEFQDKKKETCLEKYGVEHHTKSKEVQDNLSISLANNFQSRRNEEGTDYNGVVYILYFPEHNAVKIGLAGDFSKRSKGLIKDFGDFSIVKLIETDSCYKLEQELHEKYSDFRICLDEGDGRTEFFKVDILGDILMNI